MDPLNQEFARLLANSGWTKAEAARQLLVTPAAITRYLNGETRPSRSILKLFKLLIHDSLPFPGESEPAAVLRETPQTLQSWELDILNALRSVEDKERKALVPTILKLLRWAPQKKIRY